MARTVRHETGDLLQTVYSAVSILQGRLPAEAKLERRLLEDLQRQAELCRCKLDAIHDLTCPPRLDRAPLDLSALLAGLATRFSPRNLKIQVHVETPGPLVLVADGPRLTRVGTLLLVNACQAAHRHVWLRAAPEGETIRWTVTDDGPGARPEQLGWRTLPFTTTDHAQFGIGLALADWIARLHGGRVEAGNLPEGGFQVALIVPVAPPP